MFQVNHLNFKYTTEILWSNMNSLQSNVSTNIYSYKRGFSHPYHMMKSNGGQVGFSLSDFIHGFGVPDNITFDGAEVHTVSNKHLIDTLSYSEIKHPVSKL